MDPPHRGGSGGRALQSGAAERERNDGPGRGRKTPSGGVHGRHIERRQVQLTQRRRGGLEAQSLWPPAPRKEGPWRRSGLGAALTHGGGRFIAAAHRQKEGRGPMVDEPCQPIAKTELCHRVPHYAMRRPPRAQPAGAKAGREPCDIN